MTKPITRKTVLTLASLALVGVGGVLVLRPLARDGSATAEVQASSDAGPAFGERAELSRGRNSAEGPCTFALRSRMAYQVITKSTSKMDMGPLLSEIEIQGGTVSAQATTSEQTASRDWRLELEALARATDGSTVVAARIDAAPTQVAGTSAASAGSGLDSTFLIRVNAQCNVQDFGRRTDGERPVAQDQQQLVAGLSYLAPAGGEDRYQGTNLDSLGRYFATYSVEDGGLLRGRALEYRETFGQVVGGMAPKFEIGESSIEVHPQEGEWFSQLNHRREVDISMAGHSIGTVRSTVVGKRVAPAGRIEAVDLHDGGWRWGILLGQPAIDKDSHAAPESAQVGVPMREALAQYLAQTAASGSSLDAVPLLVEWLQANPEGAADIVDQLRSGAFDGKPRASAGVFLALGTSGVPEATTALLDIVSETGDEPGHRISAAHALTQIENPTETMLDTVIAAAQGDVHPSTRGALVMSVGSFASSNNERAPELASQAREQIGTWLADPTDTADLGTSLLAAGNTGHGDLVAAIDPYFEHDDPEIRGKATHALRHMPPEDAYPRLSETMTDGDLAVRATAAETALAVSRERGVALPDDIVDIAIEHLDMGRPARENKAMLGVLGEAAKHGSEGADAVLQQHLADELEAGSRDIDKLRALGKHTNSRWTAQ